jgi:hypothetical protein
LKRSRWFVNEPDVPVHVVVAVKVHVDVYVYADVHDRAGPTSGGRR